VPVRLIGGGWGDGRSFFGEGVSDGLSFFAVGEGYPLSGFLEGTDTLLELEKVIRYSFE